MNSLLNLFFRIAPIYLRAMISMPTFTRHVERRKHFWLRFSLWTVLGTLPVLGVRYLLSLHNTLFLSVLMMLFIYLLINLGACFCFRGSLWTSMLIASSAYATQDLIGHLKELLLAILGYISESAPMAMHLFLDVLLLVLVNAILAVLLHDKLGHGEEYLDNRFKALLSMAVMFVCIGMGRLINVNVSRNMLSVITESVYAILTSAMLLLLQYSAVLQARAERETEAMRETVRLQRLQFEMNRENIWLVNEKYHDIQKLLRVLDEHVPREQVEALRSQVAGYDAQTHTGNEVMDVILTEKRLLCGTKGIQFTSMVDGKALAFVDELDLYTLFSNLLSNAVEAVERLSQGEERFITLTVRETGNMVAIHAENPCPEQLRFENGLPRTSGDPRWHGFGIKSMERVAEKYGGTLTVAQNEGLFRIDILLFPPEEKKHVGL